MKDWYYLTAHTRQGPVSEKALRSLWATGEVNGDTYVWTESMGDQWKPLKDMPEWSDAHATPSATATPSVQAILAQRTQHAPSASEPATPPKRQGRGSGLLWFTLALVVLAVGILCFDFLNLAWLVLIGFTLMGVGLAMRREDAGFLEWSFMWGFCGGSTWQGRAVAAGGVLLLIIGVRGCAAPNHEARHMLASDIRRTIGGGASTVGSKKDVCASKRGMIEYAKDHFAVSQQLRSGTTLTPAQVERLDQFLAGGWAAVRCPAGGTYEIGPIGTPPRCSIHGREAP